MKRVALLIGAPGWEGKGGFLPGVAHDIANYKRFLLSPTGGAWTPDEIIRIPLNPELGSLVNAVNRIRADYALIVFSGHGALEAATGKQRVAVNPRQHALLHHLVPKVPKALVLVDACRVLQDIGLSGFLGDEPRQFPNPLPAATARQHFARQVAACVPGYTTLYGCQPGGQSQDTRNGGNFSLSLLDAVNTWVRTPSPMACLTAPESFQHAAYRLRNQAPRVQQPELSCSLPLARHAAQLPFAFRFPGQTH